MSVELQKRKVWPVEDTLGVAATAQLVGTTNTFDIKVKFIEIGYCDLDCFIAPTEAALASAADGGEGERIFVKAETGGRIIPWDDTKDVWFINATGGETPTIYLNGMF